MVRPYPFWRNSLQSPLLSDIPAIDEDETCNDDNAHDHGNLNDIDEPATNLINYTHKVTGYPLSGNVSSTEGWRLMRTSWPRIVRGPVRNRCISLGCRPAHQIAVGRRIFRRTWRTAHPGAFRFIGTDRGRRRKKQRISDPHKQRSRPDLPELSTKQ